MARDLDVANDIIGSPKFINFILEQPYGKNVLDFLNKLKEIDLENFQDIYNICKDFKYSIMKNK